MKPKYLIVLSLCLILVNPQKLAGQKILIDETPEKSLIIPKWGPNRDHYLQLIMDVQIPLEQQALGETYSRFASGIAGLSLQYKKKVQPKFSLVASMGWLHEQYQYPTELFRRDWISMNWIVGQAALRFNLDPRRGNHLGWHINLGTYQQYALNSSHTVIKQNSTATNTFSTKRIKEPTIHTLPKITWGWYAGIGYKRLEVFTRLHHRSWSNLIPGPVAKLPKSKIGIRISLTD